MNLESDATPKAFPLNRIVVILSPFVSVLAGSLATWLLVHVHFLSLFHLGHDGLSTGIAQLVIFVVTVGLTYAAHHKWLDGWQKWEAGLLALEQARIVARATDAGEPVAGVAAAADDPVPAELASLEPADSAQAAATDVGDGHAARGA